MQQEYVSLMCGISRNFAKFETSHLCGHLKSSFPKVMATCFDLPQRYLQQTFGEVYLWEQPGCSEEFRRVVARAAVTWVIVMGTLRIILGKNMDLIPYSVLLGAHSMLHLDIFSNNYSWDYWSCSYTSIQESVFWKLDPLLQSNS